VPNPPSPNLNESEKLRVALIIWLMVSCTDPTRFSCGDIANLDGLGGTRCGVAGGSLSEDELISMDESESTAYAFRFYAP
jgi:hypothetical protein